MSLKIWVYMMSQPDVEVKKAEFIILDGEDARSKIKWLTGFENGFTFPHQFKQHAQVKRWCEDNCSDKITYYSDKTSFINNEYLFFFAEEDAMAFKLVWVDDSWG